MQLPLIHLNGTSRETLLGEASDACTAIRAALDAVANATPNGRDYYPLGVGAFTTAQREHMSRMERLSSVLSELETLAEAIANANATRNP